MWRQACSTAGGKMYTKAKLFRTLAVASVTASSVLAAVATSGASTGSIPKGQPVKIGISLSLTADFSPDGLAFERGYKLWAADVNKAGGLLKHKVSLDIKNDASTPTQVVTNYQSLISRDHVNLTFGPFSSLLTLPAARAVNRYGYAMVEGAGGAPSVFQAG